MATLYGTVATLAQNPDITKNPDPKYSGNVKVVWDDITLASATSGTVIEMQADLPKDAVIVDVVLYNAALGTSTTLKVGDNDDDDRYITATSTSSAGTKRMTSVGGAGYVIGTADDDNQIIVTVGGATASGNVKVFIYYR